MFHGMGIETGTDLDRLIDCAVLAEEILGTPVPGQVMRAGPWPPTPRGRDHAGCAVASKQSP